MTASSRRTEDANLRAIELPQRAFGQQASFSGHTTDGFANVQVAPMAAVLIGWDMLGDQ